MTYRRWQKLKEMKKKGVQPPDNPAAHQAQQRKPLPESIEGMNHRFMEWMRIRNFSEKTIEVYDGYLRLFYTFLLELKITDLTTITESVIAQYQRDLFYRPTYKGTPRTPTALNRAIASIKGLCKFMKAEGYIVRDPSQDIEYARKPNQLPRNVLTPEEAKKIVETPDTSTVFGYRDRTMLEVLYATGLRKNELRALKLQDVNLEEQLLFVREGKGKKDRVVPLGSVACKFLENYIKIIRGELLRGKMSDGLFISLQGKPIGEGTVRWVVEKYAALSGVKKHVTCHLWRHTCATHLVQNQANLRHVQEMLGHGSLATTERYLSLTINDLKEAHRKFHPREKDRGRE